MILTFAALNFAAHEQVDASGRLAFCRLTLCNEGLSALLWLARMIPVLQNPSQLSPRRRPPPLPRRPSPDSVTVRTHSPDKISRENSRRQRHGGLAQSFSGDDAGNFADCVDLDDQSPRPATPLVPRRVMAESIVFDAVQSEAVSAQGLADRWCVQLKYVILLEIDRADVVLVESRTGVGIGGIRSREGAEVTVDNLKGLASRGSIENSPSMPGPTTAALAGEVKKKVSGTSCALPLGRDSSTRLRLSIPRIGLNARSVSTVDTDLATNTTDNDNRPAVTLTAEWIEGHLEMEDPGTAVLTPAIAAIPTETATAAVKEGQHAQQSHSAQTVPSMSAVCCVLPAEDGFDNLHGRKSDSNSDLSSVQLHEPAGLSRPSPEAVNQLPTEAPPSPTAVPTASPAAAHNIVSEALGLGGPSSAGDGGRGSPESVLPAPRVKHRLRWLTVCRASALVMPARRRVATAGVSVARGRSSSPPVVERGIERVSGDSDEDGAVGDGPAGGNVSSAFASLKAGNVGKDADDAKPERTQEQIGVEVDGVWAEWSPALFFLAGKSGGMVRTHSYHTTKEATGRCRRSEGRDFAICRELL